MANKGRFDGWQFLLGFLPVAIGAGWAIILFGTGLVNVSIEQPFDDLLDFGLYLSLTGLTLFLFSKGLDRFRQAGSWDLLLSSSLVLLYILVLTLIGSSY
ncbi:hypothetical protein KC644_00255 [Candidatus Berkelbacteria bacterium]|nr:hypothetical protein [Candidatus Berkelbacteria bacterium]